MTIDQLPGFRLGPREHSDLLDAQRTNDADFIAQHSANALHALAEAAQQSESTIAGLVFDLRSGFLGFIDAGGDLIDLADPVHRDVSRTVAGVLHGLSGAVGRYIDGEAHLPAGAPARVGFLVKPTQRRLMPRRPVPLYPRSTADVSAMLRDPRGRIGLAMMQGRRGGR